MRMTHRLAAVLIALGTATALAAPASADNLDQQFLQALQDKGVTVQSDQWALDLAHKTCDLLHNGGTLNDALRMLVKTTKWSADKATNFGALAVYAYCKEKLPAGTGG